MIVNGHWNTDFLLRNPGFELPDNIYAHNNTHVMVYYTEKIQKDGETNMYTFIMDGYILDISNQWSSMCYFCEFGSNDMFQFYKNEYIHHCCSDCALLWKYRENITQVSDCLFLCDNVYNISKLKPDAFFNDVTYYIMYGVLYTPIDKFSYNSITKSLNEYNIDKELLSFNIEQECSLCNYDFYGTMEDEDWYGHYVCDDCLNYAIQMIIKKNYTKYMLEKCLFYVEDINEYIINMFVQILLV